MNITIPLNKRTVGVAITSIALAIGLGACNTNNSSQAKNQRTSEQYAKKLTNAQPYPLSQMNDSDERRNLRERLLRLNNPNKIGYLAEITQTGQILGYFTVRGKPSSMGSQLTNTQNINAHYSGNPVTESMGDDGSYGPEECSAYGIFFFDTNGVMHEWCGEWAYSDAPMNLTSKPIILQASDAKPSSTAGQRN
jgi:hypothetical protein